MKRIIIIAFFLLANINSWAQVENVIVEKYYISDANDATDTTGGYLAPGTTTYRIYIDLAPGSKLRKIYGDANHLLRFSSTDNFFNNSIDGQTFGKEFSKSRLKENTVALDTWITLGQTTRTSSTTYFGVLKQFDGDGSLIGGVNNDGGSAMIPGGLLVNSDSDAGLPLTTADGMQISSMVPSTWGDFGFLDALGNDSTIFGSLKAGNEFLSNNASLQNSGVTGVSSDNTVLVAQLTTLGEISFEINLEVEENSGGSTQIVNYVAKDDTLLANERLCTFLIYPPPAPVCGCRDARFLEYDESFSCDAPDSCINLIVFGCTDTMACNYDPAANFNLPDLCCYPGNCNDRDILEVCPELSSNRSRSVEEFIYPNPAVDEIFFKRANQSGLVEDFRIFDQSGRIIETGKIENINGRIDISSLSPGTYFVQINSLERTINRVIVKEK